MMAKALRKSKDKATTQLQQKTFDVSAYVAAVLPSMWTWRSSAFDAGRLTIEPAHRKWDASADVYMYFHCRDNTVAIHSSARDRSVAQALVLGSLLLELATLGAKLELMAAIYDRGRVAGRVC